MIYQYSILQGWPTLIDLCSTYEIFQGVAIDSNSYRDRLVDHPWYILPYYTYNVSIATGDLI